MVLSEVLLIKDDLPYTEGDPGDRSMMAGNQYMKARMSDKPMWLILLIKVTHLKMDLLLVINSQENKVLLLMVMTTKVSNTIRSWR